MIFISSVAIKFENCPLRGARGATGAIGQQGPIGLIGPAGLAGPVGATGAQGVAGVDGKTVLNGTSNPISLIGNNGDFFINTTSNTLFGPKANGTWPAGVSLVGPQGPTGQTGPAGPQGTPGSLPPGSQNGEMIYWNGTSWVSILPGQTGQQLTFCYDRPQWGPCLAQIVTITATNITGFGASSGGQVVSDGGNAIISRGVCWDISPNPDLSDLHTTNGVGVGAFTSQISGIAPNTLYYVRAYATNSAGTSFGNQITFTSGADLPSVSTDNISSLTFNSATISGSVLADGGAQVTQRGICYGLTTNPTIQNSFVLSGSGLGSFTSNISGLSGNTTYYARAFATNASGTSYGSNLIFSTFSAPAAQSCSGWSGPSITSSLMGVGGYIIASPNQPIDFNMNKNYTPMMVCGCSFFTNPQGATVISSNCSPTSISQVIKFTQPGTYLIQGRNGDCIGMTICSVYVYIN